MPRNDSICTALKHGNRQVAMQPAPVSLRGFAKRNDLNNFRPGKREIRIDFRVVQVNEI